MNRLRISFACISMLLSCLASALWAKPIVAVSVLPQGYFVERISGGRVSVLTLAGPGQNPHSYDPSPRQMADLSKARAWFTVGVEFEKGLAPKVKALYPKLALVDTTVGIEYRTLEAHSHGSREGGGAEGEGGKDIHVWLGRKAVLAQAVRIRDGLVALDPEGATAYELNYKSFVTEVEAVFASLAPELAPLRGKKVFVFHPSFGYFFDEFGIIQEAVETGGKEPTQKDLASLIREAQADGARIVFVQSQFPANAATTVAKAIGGSVVPIDPLAPDWADNLRRMAMALRKSLP
jgi:zinc transport system substrate-binding protein